MNENPEGTPNPLNPVQGVKPVEPVRDTATGTGMLDYSEPTTTSPSSFSTPSGQPDDFAPSGSTESFSRPSSFSKPMGPSNDFSRPANTSDGFKRPVSNGSFSKPTDNIDGFARPNGTAGTAGNYNRPMGGIDGFSQPNPRAMHAAADPMMRPSGHHAEAEQDPYDSFEALSSSDSASGIGQSLGSSSSPMPELAAKDSIVEPASGKSSKKKPMIIGAIILIMVAAICGAAAIVVAILNNGGDKVSKAVEKLLSGQISSIISADGNITVMPNSDDGSALLSSASIKFSGTFDTASALNKVNATVNGEFKNGGSMTLDVSELTNKNGETFFKISGLNSILTAINTPNLLKTTDAPTLEVTSDTAEISLISPNPSGSSSLGTNTLDTTVTETTKTTETTDTTSGLLSIYNGLIEAADDQWIMTSEGFSSDMGDLEIFENPTTCLINAFGSLKQYQSDIAKKYKENPFITYSTDKMTIAKKKNDLYRLGFDEAKLKAFGNSLGKNGLLATINNCYNGSSTMDGSNIEFSVQDLAKLPAIYAEVDDDYNFTRFYFEADNATLDNTGSATVTADISLSYPSEVKIVEPESYIDMSTLLSDVMTQILSGSDNKESSSDNK